MAHIRTIRRKGGALLRWFANVVTGNSFKRIEGLCHEAKRLNDRTKSESMRARRAAVETLSIIQRMHDAQQYALLSRHRNDLKNRS